jgi:tetratricopeptide (TPR) repeat protein
MKNRCIPTMIAFLLLAALAVPAAMAAEENDPATLFFNQAQVAISRGQYDQAIELFDKALAENTTLISKGDTLMYIYKDKAAALADSGRYDDALTTVNEGLLQFKNSAGMWNNKGYILFRMGRYNEAIDAYTQAVTIDPAYEKGWINKGDALVKAGRAGEAVDAYNKALSLDPESNSAKEGLALAQKEAGPGSMIIILVIVMIAAAGVAVWYVMFRKPSGKKESGEKSGKKE